MNQAPWQILCFGNKPYCFSDWLLLCYLISSYWAGFSGSPLQSLPASDGEATQGSPAASGEATKRWHSSLKPSSSISTFFFLLFLLLLLFCSAPYQLQSPLQGAPHAAHPARHLQLGGRQLPSKVLHGWKAYTAGCPGARVTMGTGSPEKLRFSFVRDEGIVWMSQKAASVICLSIVIFSEQKVKRAQTLFCKKGFWHHTKKYIIHLSFEWDPRSLSIFLWFRSHKLPGTVYYLQSVKK